MTSRAPVAWYTGMIGLVVLPAAIAIVVVWVATGQQIQVNEFYTSQGNTAVVDEEEYRYWDGISRAAYQQVMVVAPTLLTGAVVAVFALLSVLAFRWERRLPRLDRAVAQADEATAAS